VHCLFVVVETPEEEWGTQLAACTKYPLFSIANCVVSLYNTVKKSTGSK
jgi:hypothetical protein